MSKVMLKTGDSLVVMKTLPDNSLDSIVTDPPYHLTTGKKGGSGEASASDATPYGRHKITTGFMGKAWDGGDVAFRVELWKEVYRIAKPGAHLLAFGGTRTYHRLACAIEDAGWEIRDCIMWVYGSGFPKSLNVGAGWGTALKPAWEPIIVARKPLTQTVAKNIQEYGTGALNIDACRVSGEAVPINKLDGWSGFGELKQPDYTQEINDKGRWPANLIHDGSDEVTQLFPDTGKSTGGRIGKKENSYVDNAPTGQYEKGDPGYGDSGSAARFFYCAKVSRREREAGCDTLPAKTAGEATGGRQEGSAGLQSPRAGASRTSAGVHNDHPTVKPIALMRYLIRLVTPRHGTVLDLFMGSGTTGCAAVLEGANFVGIDLEQHHVDIAEARIAYWQTHPYEDANEKKPLDSAPTCALPLD